MPAERFGIALPLVAELPDLPQGVVLHWTGGGPRANPVDLAAYHFVVDFDGTVHAGRWPVAANMCRVGGDQYAMHTGGFNSYRIGVSAAGMLNYHSPSDTGPHPLTEIQVDRMLEVAAFFLDAAGLDPLDPANLCTHREVWTVHGIRGTRNHLKKDIEFLPFAPDLAPDQVGDFLRKRTAALLTPGPNLSRDPLPIEPPDGKLAVPDREIDLQSNPVVPEPSWWERIRRRLGF